MFKDLNDPSEFMNDFCHICEEPLTKPEMQGQMGINSQAICADCRLRIKHFDW